MTTLHDGLGDSAPIPDVCVHTLVEQQAARTADAVAVGCGAERVIYRQLDGRANRIASALTSRGCGRGSFVPIVMTGGAAVPLAMLAVLKTGAAFVPLDADWPPERFADILDELGSPVVLTNAEARGTRLPARFPVMEVSYDGAVGPAEPADVRADDPMYAIYTSGTTGRPKAAVNRHRGIVNRLQWMTALLGAEAARAPLQTTRHVYDSAIWQFFWPLITGGRTIVPPPSFTLVARDVIECVERERVTTADFVPTVFRSIVSELLATPDVRARLSSLRVVIVGGEEIPAAAVQRFRGCFPSVRVLNVYGPTEASIGCIAHEVRDEDGDDIPIGRPIANCAAVILDEAGNVAAPGVTGDLYLGGVCVGLGYLHDPAMTRQVFVPNPYDQIDSPTLYKTGDVARWRADGRIHFAGRHDRQVKLHGHRIELGEIETVLATHPDVAACTVVLREDHPGDPRLVGYVVSRRPRAATDYSDWLGGRLPRHMVPAQVVLLAELPMTATGKLDRGALPPPPPIARETRRAPVTDTEKTVAAIWSDVLGVAEVDSRDTFLSLGGHSLLAMRAAARMRDVLDAQTSVQLMLNNPTVEEVGRAIDGMRAVPRALEPVHPIARDGLLPLSFAQQREWHLPGNALFRIFHGLRFRGPLDQRILERAFTEVVRRHEALRTVLVMSPEGPAQLVGPGSPMELPLTTLAFDEGPDSRARLLAALASFVGEEFQLEGGRLWRALLLRIADDQHVLALCFHHIICDGWSLDILENELATLYTAIGDGRPSPLPEPRVHLVDIAAWQRRTLRGEYLQQLQSYWSESLMGLVPLQLPADRTRTGARAFRGSSHRFSLPRSQVTALEQLGSREGVTLNAILGAVFVALLAKLSGQEDITVLTPTANRLTVESEQVFGYLANPVPVRTSLAGRPGFVELVRRLHGASVGALSHQQYPLMEIERVVEGRAIARDRAFPVSFQLETVERGPIRLPNGLTMEPLDVSPGTGVAPRDLSLAMTHAAGDIVGNVVFDADVFTLGTVAAVCDAYCDIVTRVLHDPSVNVY